METDETRLVNDALLGKDMEAYRKLDASLHPEQKPQRWNIGLPPELTQTPAYQELVSLISDKHLASSQCAGFVRELRDTRRYYLERAQGKLMFKDSEELRGLYGGAAAAMGRVIANAINKEERYAGEASAARERLAALEREYYESRSEVFGKTEGGH